MRKPAFCRYSAASCSPRRPRASLGCMRTTSGTDDAAAELHEGLVSAACGRAGQPRHCLWVRTCRCRWRLVRSGAARASVSAPPRRDELPLSGLLGKLQVALGQFLDIDVLEGHDPHVLHVPGRAIHIPDPRVVHCDLEEHLAVIGCAHLEVHVVGEIEPALGLNHVREEPDDVAVFAIELQLHLGLVLLEILRAHVLPSAAAGASGASSVPSALPATGAVAGGSAINSTIGPWPSSSIASTEPSASTTPPGWSRSSAGTTTPALLASFSRDETFTNERRCTGLGPQASRAAI